MNTSGLTESRFKKITEMLYRMAKRENITNPKIEITNVPEDEKGYYGENSLVMLRGDNNNCMELFVKGAPTDEAFKLEFDARPVYLLEIMFYNDILPIFNEFQYSKKIPKPFTSVINCLETCSELENEILILQNVKVLGYELWNMKKQMNKEHVKFFYHEIGKYHGIFFALKDQQPKLYRDLLDRLPVVALEQLVMKMLTDFTQTAEKGRTIFDPIKEADMYNKCAAYIDYLPEFLQTLASEKDPYMVIIHGDPWCNNMMFKYSSNSEKICPEKMCLVDFQLVGEASPVLDLSYFIYSTSPKQIYDNLDHYLHVYHDSLSETIRDLGSDPEVLMPFAQLKNHWKKFSRYGLTQASMVINISVQEADESMDFSDATKTTERADLMAAFTKEERHAALYNERLRSLLEHMIENQFL